MNFLRTWETFCQLPSTFWAAGRPSINIPASRETFRQLSSTLHAAVDLPLTSVNLLCGQEIFHQLLLTFLTACRPTVNFRLISVQPLHLPSTSVNFPCGQRTVRELFVRLGGVPSTFFNFSRDRETFHQPSSAVHALGRPSIKFHQVSVLTGDFPSTSVNFPCSRYTFHELLTALRTTEKPSVNFHQVSVRP